MMAIDTSALMSILLDEPEAEILIDAIATADALCMSAATLSEALIVADRRGVRAQMDKMIDGLAVEIVSVSGQTARKVAETYGQWGKGLHPAGLNFGDCFSYALAAERGCPLLFVGDDFSRTDVRIAAPR